MNQPNVTDLEEVDKLRALAEDQRKLADKQEVDDLKWLMSNKRGRRFVFALLERAGIWRLSFNADTHVMAFNEGTRNEGLRLWAMLQTHCAERCNDMLMEHRSK